MARQKSKKSFFQELKKTIHSLTAPNHKPKRNKRLKATPTKKVTDIKTTTLSTLALQKQLEQQLTQKIDEGMQKIKQNLEQELLIKLTNKEDAIGNSDDSPRGKKSKAQKGIKANGKSSTKPEVRKYIPDSDCTLLKILTLSDERNHKVVVGYEVIDNSSRESWGIDIREGARLARNNKIANTKVKSRKVGEERQYYLIHVTDEALYYTEDYTKAVLERGRLTIKNYTSGLVKAIETAYKSGYTNNGRLPKMRN